MQAKLQQANYNSTCMYNKISILQNWQPCICDQSLIGFSFNFRTNCASPCVQAQESGIVSYFFFLTTRKLGPYSLLPRTVYPMTPVPKTIRACMHMHMLTRALTMIKDTNITITRLAIACDRSSACSTLQMQTRGADARKHQCGMYTRLSVGVLTL